jgi:DUF971 family protein
MVLDAAPSSPPFDANDTPVKATVSRGGTALRMDFADAPSATAGAETLRLNCRCAWCTRARADGRFPGGFPDAAIAEVNPIGGYAVHVVFVDGHDRGVFPWTYLRALACEDAAADAA